jgi:hypothetical protein
MRSTGTWRQRKNRREGTDQAFLGGGTRRGCGPRPRSSATDGVEHIIKNDDGKIAEKDSEGHDPRKRSRVTPRGAADWTHSHPAASHRGGPDTESGAGQQHVIDVGADMGFRVRKNFQD